MIDDTTAPAPARAPLTPEDCCLSDFEYIPLDVARLRKSKAWLLAKRKPELAFYMLNLWTAAWHETPAASLEDDDDVLADRAMCDPDKWLTIKADVLRGFVACTDGRLYHEVVAIKALEAWIEKLGMRISSMHGNAKRYNTKADDTHLREQIRVAMELLFALHPMSKAFGKKHTQTAAEQPKKPGSRRKPAAGKSAPPQGNSSDLPPGEQRDPGGLASKGNGSEGNGSEGKGADVGGTPPTTPGADAPGEQEGGGAEPTVKPRRPTITLADTSYVPPEWVPREAWVAFEESRWAKHQKQPYTLAAQKGIVSKLDQLRATGQDVSEMLMASVRNGWTDVYAIKNPTKPTLGGGGGGGGAAAGGRYAGAAAAVFGNRGQGQRGEVIDVEAR